MQQRGIGVEQVDKATAARRGKGLTPMSQGFVDNAKRGKRRAWPDVTNDTYGKTKIAQLWSC